MTDDTIDRLLTLITQHSHEAVEEFAEKVIKEAKKIDSDIGCMDCTDKEDELSLEKRVVKCFDNFSHDIDYFGDTLAKRTVLAQKYIKYIMQEVKADRDQAVQAFANKIKDSVIDKTYPIILTRDSDMESVKIIKSNWDALRLEQRKALSEITSLLKGETK